METNQKRPVLLSILCVLTFIWSGLMLFSSIVTYLMFDQLKSFFSAHPNIFSWEPQAALHLMFHINPAFFLLQGIFSGLAVAGAFLMWNLKKVGFHLYVIAQLILLMIPKIFIPHLPFPFFQLAISFLFVYFYYRHLPFME